ncbi:pickpocket protein 28-like [Procambarus clarkii]|uniref:pickpocket protein 28-like n=1 Tax=Procambarus clarkii TaxID=6728 RepID=UPI0037421C63
MVQSIDYFPSSHSWVTGLNPESHHHRRLPQRADPRPTGSRDKAHIPKEVIEFCQETSFNGIKYIVKREFSLLQRWFWFVCWLTSFMACCYYILSGITEYETSPTLTTIDTTDFPVSKVGFPFVTFCNLNQVAKSRHPPRQEDTIGRVKYTASEWSSLTYEVYQNVLSMEHLNELANSSVLQLDSHEVYCIIKKSAHRCEDLILFCLWSGTEDCRKLFTQVSTSNGFCCVFNQNTSATQAGGAANHREAAKTRKYRDLEHHYNFVPIASETLGAWVEGGTWKVMVDSGGTTDDNMSDCFRQIDTPRVIAEPGFSVMRNVGRPDGGRATMADAIFGVQAALLELGVSLVEAYAHSLICHNIPTLHLVAHCPRVHNTGERDGCPNDDRPSLKKKSRPLESTHTEAGVRQGLTVMLDAQVDEYTYSTFHSVGFKMVLQEPTGPPSMGHYSVVISPGTEAFVPLDAHSTFTTQAALNLRPDERKCYKDQEKRLVSSPEIYTHEACVLDYHNSLLQRACGCRDFHMKGPGNICYTQEDIGCMRKFSDRWHAGVYMQQCNSDPCYSRCNTTTYLASPSFASLTTPYMEKTWLGLRFLVPTIKALCRREILKRSDKVVCNSSRSRCEVLAASPCSLKTPEDAEHLMGIPEIRNVIINYLEKNAALVHVYFKRATSTLYKRDLAATTSQLVANIGGLLGLFLGFSLLSAAEIVFYSSKMVERVCSYMGPRNPSQVQPRV